MAALFDTTVAVLLLRRRPSAESATLIRAARTEIDANAALLTAVGVSELLIGERHEGGAARLAAALSLIPAAAVSEEAAANAGVMGAFLVLEGAPIPLPDLLIAGTAVWLQIPLLTWDGDYARSRDLAVRSGSQHTGAGLWRQLELHPASRRLAEVTGEAAEP